MKWFDRWFYRKVRWAWGRAGEENPEWKAEQDSLDQQVDPDYADEPLTLTRGARRGLAIEREDILDGMRITIKKLRGGYVVSVRHSASDSQKSYVEPREIGYIINEDQDFDTELCKILSMERMHQT